MSSYIRMMMAMVCCVAGAQERGLAYNTNPCAPGVVPTPAPVYNTTVTTTPGVIYTTTPVATSTSTPQERVLAFDTTVEPNPCAPGVVPTPAPVTVTTTPAATYTTTPAATHTTTPAATHTTTPAATHTTSPAATYTTTPATTYTTTPIATYTSTPPATNTTTPPTPAPASPCGPVAPRAKFAVDQVVAKKRGQSMMQRMGDTPITSGLFGLLLASAVIGMAVRFVASRRRSSRISFAVRAITGQEGSYDSVQGSDLESNQAFIE